MSFSSICFSISAISAILASICASASAGALVPPLRDDERARSPRTSL